MSSFEQRLEQREAAYRSLVLKAQENPAFRELLKTDPARAVKEVLGQDWPEGITLDVIEETDTRCVLVLPAVFAAANDDELSDDDLELVAAGVMMTPQPKVSKLHLGG
ncbi:NHLP leader peptide family RiPP precursor [Magnetospirillum sulfuroxidans]|uniref:NHLP leader peptide family RiPP n=1 Tax=Magnetospirillum sulfuroxidans TaxID=611300 RepID=A0ABS5IDN4_9PROT|nr:NHLP leader peptide family RiPP precursor [Magnetospirillum sulfuroxidans]MBR9972539.1 NHLP leader peptide family RiPP precursor [Magnetospirillum sulfuroxidans]